jgi:glycosyltransferase involved in cell wall biosynthesis
VLIGIDASRAVASSPTGTEVYSLNVIRELLRASGDHRFRLYFRQAPLPNLGLTARNAQQRVIGPRRLWTHLGLSWEVVKSPPDVLYVPAHVLPAVRRSRAVVTIHDVGYLDYPEAYTRSRWLYLHWSTAFSAKVATLIIADSYYTKAELVRRYGVEPDKVRVVHLAHEEGLAPVEEKTTLESVRSRYGIDGDYFIYLGTIQPRKNVFGLLRAYAELASRPGKTPKLVLVGRPGWLHEPLFRAVKDLNIESDVVFTGYVPDNDVPALLSGALALVFPSFYEGFGLPALQAMACGTPVIASNVTSLPEVIGEAGLLIDPRRPEQLADTMALIAGDDSLRRELRDRGLERASQFSWKKCAAETLSVLEEAGV